MPLAAEQVISAVAARLSDATRAGARVYTDRVWPLAEKDLPAWKVVAADEDIEPQTIHPPALNLHRLQIELHGHSRAIAGLDHELHELASEALAVIFDTPATPDGLTALTEHVALSQRRIERAMKTDGEAAMGLVLITLRAEYQTLGNDPDTIL